MAYTNLTVTKGNQSKVVRVPVAGLNPLSMMLTAYLNSRVNARRTRKLLAYTAAIGAQM